MDEQTYTGIVDLVYDAALDESLWPRALERMGDAFNAGPAALLFQDQVDWSGWGATARLDPAALSAFYAYYAARNPLVALNHLPAREQRLPITTDEQVLPKAAFEATEYYTDFYGPNGMHSALMIAAAREGRSAATINLMRSRRAPSFDTTDVEQARRLQPHLVRAMSIALRLAAARRESALLDGIMERSRHGLFLIGRDGLVRRANDVALALLGEGLQITRDELVASDAAVGGKLRRLVGEACNGGSGGILRLARAAGRPARAVIVAPLGPRTATLFSMGAGALVMVSDAALHSTPDQSLLAEIYDLTPAEIRLAERLVLGETPVEAARMLDVRLSTIRWHLASLYRKTGTGRQAELVRLLLSLPGG